MFILKEIFRILNSLSKRDSARLGWRHFKNVNRASFIRVWSYRVKQVRCRVFQRQVRGTGTFEYRTNLESKPDGICTVPKNSELQNSRRTLDCAHRFGWWRSTLSK